MAETNIAGSSPVEMEDAFKGRTDVGFIEFDQWRKDNRNPKPAEPAESAPADVPEETESEGEEPESAGESETPKEQPQEPKSKAEQRKAQLRAAIEKEWAAPEPDYDRIGKLEATYERVDQGTGQKRKAEVAPAAPVPPPQAIPQQPGTTQNFNQWFNSFNADQWTKDYSAAHPELSYERIMATMGVYVSDVRDQFREAERKDQELRRDLDSKIEAGKKIYGPDFGKVADDMAGILQSTPGIDPLVIKRLAKSDIMPHVAFVLNDPETRDEFIRLARSDTFGALDRITILESGIREELEKGDSSRRNSNGQFAKAGEKAPEPKRTSAPKPPVPVNGGSARAFDLSDDQSDIGEWFRARNAQIEKRKRSG